MGRISGESMAQRSAQPHFSRAGQSQEARATPASGTVTVPPRYDLTDSEAKSLEAALVDEVRAEVGPDIELAAAWIRHDHRYANVLRSIEVRHFPEVSEVPADWEARTLFAAIIDFRSGSGRVVHAAAVSTQSSVRTVEPAVRGTISSPFITVDALVDLNDFTVADFVNYYTAQQIDLAWCVGVETNYRVGPRVERWLGLDPSALAYLLFFRRAQRAGAVTGRAGVFATINRASIISFGRLGLPFLPLMNRSDLVTPESILGVESLPVFIPFTAEVGSLFAGLESAVEGRFAECFYLS